MTDWSIVPLPTSHISDEAYGVNWNGKTKIAPSQNVVYDKIESFAHPSVTVVDSSSIDFTLTGQSLTAVALPAGINHNSLSNYVANEHINHTVVNINTTSPLSGGGDISANRTLTVGGLSNLGTANYLVGTNAGVTAWEYKNLLGTANQISVTHGVGSIALALPQNIHTGASPTFAGMTLSSGNLGIGTTSPSGKLHIWGTGNLPIYFETTSTSISQIPRLTFIIPTGSTDERAGSFECFRGSTFISEIQLGGKTGATDMLFGIGNSANQRLLYLQQNGNLGIGTTIPSRTLSLVDPGVGFDRPAVDNLGLYTANVERMRIDASGNVGIGTTSPSRRFSLVDPGVGLDRPAGDSLGLYTANVERMRIDASGNVGIGTTSPSGKLHIWGTGNLPIHFETTSTSISQIPRLTFMTPAGSADERAGSFECFRGGTFISEIQLGGKTGATDMLFGIGNSANQRLLYLQQNGNLGIGTMNPTSKIHSSGSVAVPIRTVTANYTATTDDYTILANSTAGAITISLPTAVGIKGRLYRIVKVDSSANVVTIDPSGTETIRGTATFSLSSQWAEIRIQSNDANWI